MASSLKQRIREAAMANAGLTALLGTSPFRWYDMRKPQNAGLPCVVVTVVSGSPTYTVLGRLPSGWSRVSFVIWGATPGSTSAFSVETALENFLDTLNLTSVPTLPVPPVNIIMQKDMMYQYCEPPIYQRIVDVNIFSNDNLS